MENRTFLFITFNKNERIAFLEKLENQITKTFMGGIIVTYGKFGKYNVTHFHSPYQGSEAQMAILNAIQSIKPDAVILVGIACGANVKDKAQKKGDVLISKNVIDYDFHKDNNGKIEQRGSTVPSGDILYSLFSHYAFDWKMKYNLAYHCGDIISSTVLLNDPQKKKEIFELYHNHPVGYEMEGGSTFKICRNSNIQQWIIIKGISDFGDGKKKSDVQLMAAQNAVSLCYYVFLQDGLNSVPKVFYDSGCLEKKQYSNENPTIHNTVFGDCLSDNSQKFDFGSGNHFGSITINNK
ncbi:MAG: hypothetical protein K2G55_17545 [Lachnospiraceae bacterium]|nr:hypothetical protein [Lachnospiraceae bacterium]MDE7200670.1 hypothetical protein [Lachnospiraceae bacterium]